MDGAMALVTASARQIDAAADQGEAALIERARKNDPDAWDVLYSTHYRAIPGDPAYKHALVVLDRWALRVYSVLKRYAGLRDGMIDKLLGRF